MYLDARMKGDWHPAFRFSGQQDISLKTKMVLPNKGHLDIHHGLCLRFGCKKCHLPLRYTS